MVDRDEYEFIARFRTEALDAAREAEQALKDLADATEEAGDAARDNQDVMKELAIAAGEVTAAFVLAREAVMRVGDALGVFSDFETRMVAVRKVVDLTNEEFEQLQQTFEQLASDKGLPIEQFTDVATVAGQLGIQGVQNIAAFSAAMVDLSGASDLAAEEAATTIARLLGLFEEDISGAETLASVMVELGNNVRATESEIANIAMEVGRATASFDTGSTFAAGMGAAMAELGLRAETAGTAVGRIFSEMALAAAQGGSTAKQFADAMGLSMEEFGMIVEQDAAGAFNMFMESLSQLSQSDALVILDELKLANAESQKTLLPLISNYERLVDVMKLATDEANDPNALAQEAFAASQTLAREYEGLLQDIQTRYRELGETWAPVATELVRLGKDINDIFEALPEEVRELAYVMSTVLPIMLSLRLAMVAIRTAAGALGITSLASAFGTLMGGVSGATAAMTALRAALTLVGGPLGLVVTALTSLYFLLPDTQDEIAALEEAGDLSAAALDRFAAATKRAEEDQERLGGKVEATTQRMLQQSRVALQDELRNLEEELDDLRGSIDSDEANSIIRGIDFRMQNGGPSGRGNNFVDDMLGSLRDIRQGEGDLEAFVRQFENLTSVGREAQEVINNYDLAFKDHTVDLPSAIQDMVRYAESVGVFGAELEALEGTEEFTGEWIGALRDLRERILEAEEASKIIGEEVPQDFIDAAIAVADAEVQVEALNAALRGNLEEAQKILGLRPFDDTKDSAEDAREEVQGLLRDIEAVLGISFGGVAGNVDMNLVNSFGNATDGQDASARLLRQFEGFRATPYWDVNALRAGFGSDTITLDDGSVRRVVQGTRVSVEDANRDLRRRIGEFQQGIIRDIGPAVWANMNPAQQAALTSIAYNYGSIGSEGANIADVVRTGSNAQIAGRIRGLAGHNDGVNRDRRLTEAAIFEGNIGVEQAAVRSEAEARKAAEEYNQTLEERLELAMEAAEERKEFLENNRQVIDDMEHELGLIGLSTREQARRRAEYELMNDARARGIDIDRELTSSGRTYREEIKLTAEAMADLAVQEEARNQVQQRVAEQQEFMNQQQEAFKDGILDAILEGENLIDVLGGIAKAFARAALEAALFGSGPFGGGGGGILSGVMDFFLGGLGKAATVGSAKGNVFHQSALIPMAKGGTALLGEAGPEAVMPLDRMPDGSLGVRARGGDHMMGGMNIHYAPTFNIDVNGNVQQAEQGNAPDGYQTLMDRLDTEVRQKVVQVLGEELQSGGLLNQSAKVYG